MRVDARRSAFQEASSAKSDFTRGELRHLRLLLRRLRFLEKKTEQSGGLTNQDANGGAAFVEMEAAALEWTLTEVGFLADPKESD